MQSNRHVPDPNLIFVWHCAACLQAELQALPTILPLRLKAAQMPATRVEPVASESKPEDHPWAVLAVAASSRCAVLAALLSGGRPHAQP